LFHRLNPWNVVFVKKDLIWKQNDLHVQYRSRYEFDLLMKTTGLGLDMIEPKIVRLSRVLTRGEARTVAMRRAVLAKHGSLTQCGSSERRGVESHVRLGDPCQIFPSLSVPSSKSLKAEE
jgi:hypothetical protein